MAKYIRDIVLSCVREIDPQFNFNLETNFLEVLYLNNLPKVRTDGIAKVIVQACKDVPPKKIDDMINVLRLWKCFDFEAYWKADKKTRKRIALEFLQDGLLDVAGIRGWDADPFHKAYKAVLAKELINERPWRWSKPVASPNRKLKAQAWVNYDSDKADIFVVITRNDQILSKTQVTTVKPGDVWINEVIGKLEWSSPCKLSLISKDAKQSWDVEVEL